MIKKIKLSLIMPGIRVSMWEGVYKSIQKSITSPFELIIVSPHALPPSLESLPNIKYIKDYGNLIRCYNMGILLAEGEYLTFCADDGLFIEGALDTLIKQFEEVNPSIKTIFCAKYTENGDDHDQNYFIINNAEITSSPFIDNSWLLLLQPLMYTEYFLELGGFDYRFEVIPMAAIDFSVRAYRDGADVHFKNINIQRCTWLGGEGHEGDHGPVHEGQTQNDIPLYQQIHRNPELANRTKLNFSDWKKTPSIWERRFKINMQKPAISIVLSSNNPDRWTSCYNSLQNSTTRSFELIIISQYPLPPNLQPCPNIKYVKDYGSPTRHCAIASQIAEGTYITYIEDGSLYFHGGLDNLINSFEYTAQTAPNEKNILLPGFIKDKTSFIEKDCLINKDKVTKSKYIPDNWYKFISPVMYTTYFQYLGGLDLLFEDLNIASTDLAIRAYRDGAVVKFHTTVALHLTLTADPSPQDIEIYKQIHSKEESLTRSCLINNKWKQYTKTTVIC